MSKLITLRNIITLFSVLFLIACNKSDYQNPINLDVKTVSSEDMTDASFVISEIKDPETGKVVIVFKQQQ